MEEIIFTLGEVTNKETGDVTSTILFTVPMKKTWLNRFKFWMFFKFFPFKFREWE